MSIVQHLETHLGEICRGWGERDSPGSVQVVEFDDQPSEGVITYSTLGLSDSVLPLVEGKTVREELVFAAYPHFNGEQIASFLTTFAQYLFKANKALLRGDVIGPNAPIIFGTLLNSVYAAIPVLFPEDSFAVYDETVPSTVLVWVIPIHEEEANFVRANGWTKFEELLERFNPDLWDLRRKSLV